MRYLRNEYLQRCYDIRDLKGISDSSFGEPGTLVARGYADLGYEVFSFLTDGRLISLLTGETSDLPDDHRGHFFVVPTLDQLLAAVDTLGFDIISLDYQDQREWRVLIENKERDFSEYFVNLSLEEALLEALGVIQNV